MGFFGESFDKNKLKSHLKMAITRIDLLKNKKQNFIKVTKRQVAELLQQQKDESARIKVETIIREDYSIEALEILELFCDLVQTRLQLVVESKTCPHDMKEAISTLIYAAPRIDIPELMVIRKQLELKYGKPFVEAAMENKDLAVNQRVMFKLGIKVPEPYLCVQYLKEIAKENNLEWDEQNVIDGMDQSGSNPNMQLQQQQQQQQLQQQQLLFQQQQLQQQLLMLQQQQLQMQPPQIDPSQSTLLFPSTPTLHQQGATPAGYQVLGFNPTQTTVLPTLPVQPTGFIPPSIPGQVEPPSAMQTLHVTPEEDIGAGGSYDFDELQKRFEALKKRE